MKIITRKNVRNMRNILIMGLITILVITVMPIAISAYEAPSFNDGLVGPWHPGALCIYCHYSLSTTEKAQSISNGCKCHTPAYKPKDATSSYSVDTDKILNLHQTFVCYKCHVSINTVSLTAKDIHKVHDGNVQCTRCHKIENNTYKIPEKNQCYQCHGGDPHVVHGNKTGTLCPACHGEFGERYLNNTLRASEVPMLPPALVKNETITVKEYPTILDFLGKFVNSIRGL